MSKDHDTEDQETGNFLDKVTVALDTATDEIDRATITRLQAIRREALATAEGPVQSAWWVPAGSLAAVATLAVMTVSLWTITSENEFMLPLEDIALLSDTEELEFYQELDFYLWLDSNKLNSDIEGNEQKTS